MGHKPKGKHGGARKGAGRKDALGEAVRTYKLLGELRMPADASEETRSLARECRETLLNVMRRPTRHSQAKIQVAKAFLEELCGKVAEEHNIREHSVTVHVIKSGKKEAVPLPSTAAAMELAITSKKEGHT